MRGGFFILFGRLHVYIHPHCDGYPVCPLFRCGATITCAAARSAAAVNVKTENYGKKQEQDGFHRHGLMDIVKTGLLPVQSR